MLVVASATEADWRSNTAVAGPFSDIQTGAPRPAMQACTTTLAEWALPVSTSLLRIPAVIDAECSSPAVALRTWVGWMWIEPDQSTGAMPLPAAIFVSIAVVPQ